MMETCATVCAVPSRQASLPSLPAGTCRYQGLLAIDDHKSEASGGCGKSSYRRVGRRWKRDYAVGRVPGVRTEAHRAKAPPSANSRRAATKRLWPRRLLRRTTIRVSSDGNMVCDPLLNSGGELSIFSTHWKKERKTRRSRDGGSPPVRWHLEISIATTPGHASDHRRERSEPEPGTSREECGRGARQRTLRLGV